MSANSLLFNWFAGNGICFFISIGLVSSDDVDLYNSSFGSVVVGIAIVFINGSFLYIVVVNTNNNSTTIITIIV
jgi:hypothetical protein